MARFEVFIPATFPSLPVDVTLRVESENWLAALKIGLQKLSGTQLPSNILCDIQEDGSIHVSDPAGRVFRIREMTEPAITPAPLPAVTPAPPAAAPPSRPRPSSVPDRVVETKAPAPRPSLVARATPEQKAEEVLTELFVEVTDVFSKRSRRQGLAFLLDLAMEKIRCEAGSVFLAESSGGDLGFAVVRGPKAAEIMRLDIKVPMGIGVVGFCALENVCLAVSDAEKDPRWYRAVSEAIGYSTRSLLCAPISSRGQVLGALEVLNKSGRDPFDQADLAVLSYLAHQAAEFMQRVEG